MKTDNPIMRMLPRYVRAEAAEIQKETAGRLKFKEDKRNSWTITYMDKVWSKDVTTREVYEFMQGFREGLKVKLKPAQMEILRTAFNMLQKQRRGAK